MTHIKEKPYQSDPFEQPLTETSSNVVGVFHSQNKDCISSVSSWTCWVALFLMFGEIKLDKDDECWLRMFYVSHVVVCCKKEVEATVLEVFVFLTTLFFGGQLDGAWGDDVLARYLLAGAWLRERVAQKEVEELLQLFRTYCFQRVFVFACLFLFVCLFVFLIILF